MVINIVIILKTKTKHKILDLYYVFPKLFPKLTRHNCWRKTNIQKLLIYYSFPKYWGKLLFFHISLEKTVTWFENQLKRRQTINRFSNPCKKNWTGNIFPNTSSSKSEKLNGFSRCTVEFKLQSVTYISSRH